MDTLAQILGNAQQSMLHDLYYQLSTTIITTIIVFLLYQCLSFVFVRRIESERNRERARIRLVYIMTFVFVLLMAKIWFKGFTTIFAVIGVVLAALVVTNKESIMNFTGWLVIQWRELFTEGDHVQILNHSGQVLKIGMFHITLLEFVNDSEKAASGRIVRIPNNAIITGQSTNYSQTSHFLAYHLSFVVMGDSDLPAAIELTNQVVTKVLSEYYQNRPEYNKEYLMRKNSRYFALVNMEPFIELEPRQEKPFGIKVNVRYYCYARDHEVIEQKIWLTLLPILQTHDKVKLSVY
jgi:small-conductance mechanosensitive channel